jgi:hypothetical protein
MLAGERRPRTEDVIMAAARAVKDIGPRLAWLTIEDDTGREWRYRRVGPADTAEVPHL